MDAPGQDVPAGVPLDLDPAELREPMTIRGELVDLRDPIGLAAAHPAP